MTDREKVIVMAYTGTCMLAGDKLGIYYQYIQEKLGHCVMTHELAYPEVQDAIREATMDDFIELCRANDEPRVLGWDEICGDNRPFVVWIETRHGDTTEPLAFVDGEYVNTDCTLFVELNFENQGDYMADNDNGFRFWTAQPTLAEMEAASWE